MILIVDIYSLVSANNYKLLAFSQANQGSLVIIAYFYLIAKYMTVIRGNSLHRTVKRSSMCSCLSELNRGKSPNFYDSDSSSVK